MNVTSPPGGLSSAPRSYQRILLTGGGGFVGGYLAPLIAEAFPDAAEDVKQSIHRIKSSPFIPIKDSIRGFVFDVATGKLNEVIA